MPATAPRHGGHIVVIGASTGGVDALLAIASALPADFPAPICIVQHVGRHDSMLPQLLSRRGPLPAAHARVGDLLRPGRIYVAPPDHHLIVQGQTLTLTHGARENHSRPAVDPLFRSAAAAWGAGAIGVVLTGFLADGTDGLMAIERCGGTTVVEDPASAFEPSMPLHALAAVAIDHCVALAGIAPLLVRLVRQPVGPAAPVRETQQRADPELALWGAVHALQEREQQLRRAAARDSAAGDPGAAAASLRRADRVHGQVAALVEMARDHAPMPPLRAHA